MIDSTKRLELGDKNTDLLEESVPMVDACMRTNIAVLEGAENNLPDANRNSDAQRLNNI